MVTVYCCMSIDMAHNVIYILALLHACLLIPICAPYRMADQKVDQIAAELTRRQQEREDTALQYKRYTSIAGGKLCPCMLDDPVLRMHNNWMHAVCWNRRLTRWEES